MKKLHAMLLKSLPGPFLAAFGTLVFVLLMQFLITYLKDLVGRGLPAAVIVELIVYSLAYMVSLAVPMAVLVTTLLAFGRLAESRAYAVAKGAGISLGRLAWPALAAGAVVALGMVYFNTVMLPESSHRVRTLWRDIRQSKPGFELQPGVFYDGLRGYTLRVDDAPAESNRLRGVLVFDHSTSGDETVIVAEQGELTTLPGGLALEMALADGEIHRQRRVRDDDATGSRNRVERYERIGFDRHRLTFDLSDLSFERTDGDAPSRTDRTMRASQMARLVDSLDASVEGRLGDLRADLARLRRADADRAPPPASADSAAVDSAGQPHPSPALDGLPPDEREAVVDVAAQRMRAARAATDGAAASVRFERQRADRYRVEIYKKYSMAVACVVFVLIGIPLGLSSRGGLGVSALLAVGIFLFYWISLVQGEKLADRGLLDPWVGMWAANALVGVAGLYLFWRERRDPAGRNPLRRLRARLRLPRRDGRLRPG